MATNYDNAAEALGSALKAHRKSYGLSQTDFDRWAKETKSKGPYGSQISMAERGKLIPQPQFFCSLADFYMALHKQSFKGLSKDLAERLSNAGPFLNHKGKPASAEDLFSMYVGHQPISDRYAPQGNDMQQAEVDAIGRLIVRLFEGHCDAMGLTRADGFSSLMSYYPNAKPADSVRSQGVLTGMAPYTLDEWQKKVAEGAGCGMRIALTRWLNRELPMFSELRGNAADAVTYEQLMATSPDLNVGAGVGPLNAQLSILGPNIPFF